MRMTGAEGWTGAVRARLRLGRLLPLGAPRDGAWLAEQAAEKVLRRAAERVPGVLPGRIRVGLADPGSAGTPAVPPPPAALPPGPLRIEAEFAAIGAVPLVEPAERLRGALFTAAGERLGLRVAAVDLRITALLDGPPEPAGTRTPVAADPSPDGGPVAAGPREVETDGTETDPAQTDRAETDPAQTDRARAADCARKPGRTAAVGPEGAGQQAVEGAGGRLPGAGAGEPPDAIAAAAAAVPGVARLTGTLGAAVRADESSVRVECATAPGHHPVEVARAVRAAVTSVLPSPLPVTVLVTDVGLGA
ncbi:hypothetical protein [Streptomyces tirandamycinicus]|uniref:Nucleopolyhedrovirus P10 family protein n=1 Tax=Streptomyces tirandamycinicus TaxID=2174846 RepID=A0A2S1SQP4_9ACTN|nr:hypothetical protein [Streptomyces tirandamycinicus]AWI28680.1 hypothetical protein DDW44_07675 [Streptomyces tirandamycinicus]